MEHGQGSLVVGDSERKRAAERLQLIGLSWQQKLEVQLPHVSQVLTL